VRETNVKRRTNLAGTSSRLRLTKREAEVLALVAAGYTNQQVGDNLGISRLTVSKHLQSIYVKLDVHTRTAAAARLLTGAIEDGWRPTAGGVSETRQGPGRRQEPHRGR